MTQPLHLKAYAKVNLGLDVLRRREDGYHEVRMIMQTVKLFDYITLQKNTCLLYTSVKIYNCCKIIQFIMRCCRCCFPVRTFR